MIEVIQGTPGSGKTSVAVARIIRHISAGGVVATNISLIDGWSDMIAKRHIFSYFSDLHRYEISKSMWSRLFHVKSLSAIKQINPCDLATGRYEDNGKYKEGFGLLILDESQLIFNTRKWDKNFEWIEFFTQHRKLGWNVILIAHTIDMIDKQIQPLCEYESRFRNLKKVNLPFLPIPVSPINLFYSITRYAGLGAGAGNVYCRDLYPLPSYAAGLYDSTELFSSDDWNKNPDPLLVGSTPAPPLGGGVGEPLNKRSTRSSTRPCLNAIWDIQEAARMSLCQTNGGELSFNSQTALPDLLYGKAVFGY